MRGNNEGGGREVYFDRFMVKVFFLKISKEIRKAWRARALHARSVSPQSCSLFSASFQTFCLTARVYFNTQKYGMFCSLGEGVPLEFWNSLFSYFTFIEKSTDLQRGDHHALYTNHIQQHNSPYAWLRQTSKFHQQASFVNKIFCICTFCAWVFFSTLLPWEFISVKLRLFLISKRGLVVKFACVT